MIDGRTVERTMGPEVLRDDGITQLTPIMRRRGLWDEDEAYLPRSYTKSHALDEGYFQGPPQWPDRVDQGQSPDLFDSPPRHDSAYYTAATDRQRVHILSTQKTSGCPREQQSKSKRTKSEREDEANAKASSFA